MKVAVIQFAAQADKAENIQRMVKLVKKAISRRATFILLPEVFHFRGNIKSLAGLGEIAEKIPGPSITPLIELAKKHHVSILAGSIYEKIPGDRKVYNTSVLIDPRGRLQAKYRKMNLFEANIDGRQIREADRLRPGKTPVVSSVGDFKIGMSICFDVRFTDLYQCYLKQNVDVVCIPSAFTYKTGKAHWEVLLRSRAIETRAYVLAPNQCGIDEKGLRHYGHSMIIDPWGTILAEASENNEEIIYANLNKDVIFKYHAILPKSSKRRAC